MNSFLISRFWHLVIFFGLKSRNSSLFLSFTIKCPLEVKAKTLFTAVPTSVVVDFVIVHQVCVKKIR